ncbi:MAG: hypothetical protein A2X48_17925 [Lentisphaerae bacterium GWF2_49_21]|nr:MAG: hypothetical protein A2X48_17925 [Lentisphaerae bacterium GWF2_49_21]
MIRGIYLRNFRNYGELHLKTLGKINIFIGRNGHGKTNLLEGLFFLSLLRSFRTSQIDDLRKIGTGGFYLGSEIISESGISKYIEAEYYDRRNLKIDKNPVSRASEFIHNFRTVVFSPHDILIVSGSSSIRRKFLDMHISSVIPEYMPLLQEYLVALQKRNAYLRMGQGRDTSKEVRAFEPILADKGSSIVKFRSESLFKISGHISMLIHEITGTRRNFSLKYSIQKGTGNREEYLSRFDQERSRDFSRQYSTFGPHLDDFEFIYDDKSLKSHGSTGQCRLASLCLKLASMRIMGEFGMNGSEIVALVDDVTGELDIGTKKAFYSVLKNANQVFFTFTEKPFMDDFLKGSKIFEVADGQVVEIKGDV